MFTGYHIEDGYITGEEMSGRFYIENAVIKGSSMEVPWLRD